LIVSKIGVLGQTAEFTTIPSHTSGDTLKLCAGSSVLFTLQATTGNLSPTSTLNWSFSAISGSNPVTPAGFAQNRSPFYVGFPNGIYQCVLSINGGASIKTLIIKATVNSPYQPNISSNLANGWGQMNIDNIVTFQNCPTNNAANIPLTLNVSPNVNTTNCTFSLISTPNISWTYNTAPTITTVNSSLSAPTNPSNRFYYLMTKSDFLNTCILYKPHYIQVGAPTINKTDGSNFVCDPGGYQFLFNEQQPGVSYEIDWNYNGSSFNPSSTYVYPNLPLNPQYLNYNYPFIPCNSGLAPQRKIRIRATNQCPSAPNALNVSFSDIQNIFVSKGPTAKLNCNPDPNSTALCDSVICKNSSLTFYNHSIPGVQTNFDGTNATCSNDYNRYWTISPSSGFSLSGSSSLGNTSSNGSDILTINFNNPGTYTIELHVFNKQ
jgi:hypothetical protein